MSTSEPLPPLFEKFPPVDIDDWREQVRKDLGTFPSDLLTWDSLEGVSMPAYFQRSDLETVTHGADTSPPPLPSSRDASGNDWRIRQPVTHPELETTRALTQEAIEGGISDLGLRLPPRPAEPAASLTTLTDLSSLLSDISFEETGVHLEHGPSSLILYAALREHSTRSSSQSPPLRGSVDYDPIAAVASGTLSDLDRGFELMEQLVRDGTDAPNFRTATVDLRLYHEAGASTVQELTFGMGALTELLDRGTSRGLSLSAIVDSLQIILSVSTSYFVEIAKLRALRLLIPQIVNAFGDKEDAAKQMGPEDVFIQAQSSGRTETIYDPYVNMLRATTEGMAAVVGGCDVLSLHPYDRALRSPNSFGTRIARNTQHILEREAHLDHVTDPAAGSYYVESLTDRLAKTAWSQFQELESAGGLVEALREGRVQREIRKTFQERTDAVDSRNRVLVGTNHYPALDEERLDNYSPAPSGGPTDDPPDDVLDPVSLSSLRTAVETGHSFSSIRSALQRGTSPVEPLSPRRVSSHIESIRLRTERYAQSHGGAPRFFLAPLGPPAIRSARATFSRNVLGVGGFDLIENLKFDSPGEVVQSAESAEADALVLCSADDQYPELATAIRAELSGRSFDPLLVVAGAPENIDPTPTADLFLYSGASLQDTLEELQTLLGIGSPDSAGAAEDPHDTT